MKRTHLVAIVILALLTLIPLASGQDDAELITSVNPETVNPAAHISFPPPVYVVRDSVDIRGTVNWDIMRNFFIEFRPLVLGMMMDEGEQNPQWFPATLPRIEAVEDDVLGSWNTATLQDGLYEIRLTINTGGDTPEYVRVSPIRVENSPPSFVAEEQVAAAPMEPEAEQETMAEDEDMDEQEAMTEPEEEAPPDTSPRVIATVNSNVRAGDSTQYAVIGHLLEGQSALVKGISSFGTNWYYIELANGRNGFIFPGIVRTEGDFEDLPRINPPPLPPTPVPIPTAVPPPPQQPQPQPQPQPQQPSTGADLYIESATINPHPVACGQTYEIRATVRNGGSAASTSGGIITVRDSGLSGSAPAESTVIAFGPLAPGHAQVVVGHITPTIHVESLHHINLYLDSQNQVAETNENNNHRAEQPYFLTGSC